MAACRRWGSISQIATTVMPGTVSMCFRRKDPRLPTPMKATRTVSLGDCPLSSSEDPSETAVDFSSRRRLRSVMPLILLLNAANGRFPATIGRVDRGAILATLRERIVGYAASRIGRDSAEDLAQE